MGTHFIRMMAHPSRSPALLDPLLALGSRRLLAAGARTILGTMKVRKNIDAVLASLFQHSADRAAGALVEASGLGAV